VIILRPAVLEDAALIFPWRNHPQVRQFFFTPEPLNFEDHCAWFERSLLLQDRVMLIAIFSGEAIGFLRFDRKDQAAEIDIYLDPSRHGQGLGSSVLSAGLSWAKAYLLGLNLLTAKVVAANKTSQRIFEKNGFQLSHRAPSYLEYSLNLETSA